MSEPTYLGDGVYAEDDGVYIALTTTRRREQLTRAALMAAATGDKQ